MSEKDIREYAKLMGELGLTGLEVDMNTGSFRLERNVETPASAVQPAANTIALQAYPQGIVQAVPQPMAQVQAAPAAAQAPQPAAADDGLTDVTSPIVGIFYQAPMENADPFVKVGDHVNEGDVLCIVEAMKLMNEITAEKSGRIAEICVEDGTPVDFNCTLFRIEEDR